MKLCNLFDYLYVPFRTVKRFLLNYKMNCFNYRNDTFCKLLNTK